MLNARDDERRATERSQLAAQTRVRETGTRRTRGKNGSDAATRLLEAQIAEAEAQLEVVKRQLLDPATFSDRAAAAHIGREHDRLTGALADLYDRWAAAIH